jgi:hypothetical protein
VARLRAIGNAINFRVAEQIIRAWCLTKENEETAATTPAATAKEKGSV